MKINLSNMSAEQLQELAIEAMCQAQQKRNELEVDISVSMLQKKLTQKSQKELLYDLLGLHVENGVIYKDGYVNFYDDEFNAKYKLTTLREIMRFACADARRDERIKVQKELRIALGLPNLSVLSEENNEH